MQNVFNRERNKYRRGYESWKEHGASPYHQHFQREDWYWKTDTSYKDRRTNYRETPRESRNYALSHHYSVLGLDRYSQKSKTMVYLICGFWGNTLCLHVLLEKVQHAACIIYYRRRKNKIRTVLVKKMPYTLCWIHAYMVNTEQSITFLILNKQYAL